MGQTIGASGSIGVEEPASYVYDDELPSTSLLVGQLLKDADVQQLFESYYSLIRIPVAVIDPNGNVLCSSRWQRICTQFHRVHPATCARCLASDREIASRVHDGLAHAIRACENGLTDCAAPLVIDGKHVANVFVGQFLTQEYDEARFRRQAEEFGFPVEDYLAAARELPFVDATRIQAILELLARMTRVLTNLAAERKRAIDAQARSAVILNTIPQAVFWKDIGGRYGGCNAAFARAAGLRSPEEVVGKTDLDLPWPRQAAEGYRRDDRVVATRNVPLHAIETLRAADGAIQVVETTKVPLPDATQTTCGVLGVFRDITADLEAREALRASEEKFRKAFMTGLDAIYIATRDEGRLVDCNDRFPSVFGYDRAEVMGRTSLELDLYADPDDRARVMAQLKERGFVRDMVLKGRKKSGEIAIVSLSISPLDVGGPPHILGVVRDITPDVEAREALRSSEEKFRKAFMTGLDAMYVTTRDQGVIVECNECFLSVFGYTRDEMIGKTTLGLGLWDDPSDRARFVDVLKRQGFVRDMELRFRKKSGETGVGSMSASPLATGGVPLMFGVIRDITEQKHAEAELETHRQHLEDLVVERTAELAAARTAADEANRAKSVFLANMSHEIRTPLNAVLGFAQLLLGDPAATPAQREHLETITRAGDHLLTLVDGILQLAKIESGRVPLVETTFDLWGVLDDVERLFAARAREKGIGLAVERAEGVPRHVRADEGKLRQVLGNLVSNAIKFTEHGGVAMRVAAPTVAEPRLVFEVEDTGPGIADRERHRLFQKFEQTESGRAARQGTGLGLAICRELVTLMRGEIAVTSRPGAGSVFRFAIPFAPGAAGEVVSRAEARRPVRLVAGQRATRVLVVDDAEDNRALLRALLERVGFQTREAGGGAEAIRAFQAWHPHAVLMDLRMPEVDGAEAIRRIRASPGGAGVKILCVSASAFDEDRTVARKVGADGFLSKPVRDVALFEKLRALLDVSYEYAAEAAGKDGARAPAGASDLSRVPAALRDGLRQATVAADLDAMLALIDEVAAHDEGSAAELRALATRFEYARIRALLEGGATA